MNRHTFFNIGENPLSNMIPAGEKCTDRSCARCSGSDGSKSTLTLVP